MLRRELTGSSILLHCAATLLSPWNFPLSQSVIRMFQTGLLEFWRELTRLRNLKGWLFIYFEGRPQLMLPNNTFQKPWNFVMLKLVRCGMKCTPVLSGQTSEILCSHFSTNWGAADFLRAWQGYINKGWKDAAVNISLSDSGCVVYM